MTLKGRIKAGRLVVDEPTNLSEGAEVELLPLDPGDWLNDEDRAALHQALKGSDEDVKAESPGRRGGRPSPTPVALKQRGVRFTFIAL